MAGGQAPTGQSARAGATPAATGSAPAATGAPRQPTADAGRASQRGGGDTATGGAPQFGANRQGGGQQFARGDGGQAQGQGMGGGRGGGRAFDPNDPEARARMIERYQQMPAAEKASYAARMKERGIDVEALVKGAKPASKPSGGGTDATTVDALFGPLPARVSQGRVYVWDPTAKKLTSIRLQLGVSDGQYTELLQGEIPPNSQLVTGIILGTDSTTNGRSPQSGNPLMQPQRGGMGGGRGR
jgi:hypothetical protein